MSQRLTGSERARQRWSQAWRDKNTADLTVLVSLASLSRCCGLARGLQNCDRQLVVRMLGGEEGKLKIPDPFAGPDAWWELDRILSVNGPVWQFKLVYLGRTQRHFGCWADDAWVLLGLLEGTIRPAVICDEETV